MWPVMNKYELDALFSDETKIEIVNAHFNEWLKQPENAGHNREDHSDYVNTVLCNCRIDVLNDFEPRG